MKFRLKISKLLQNPPLLLGISFIVVILIGTFLLNLPIASSNGESIGFVDAFFTSSSATCVTGLVVVNTAKNWTIFGHIVIIMLIQIGGLGTMVVFSIIPLILRKKIGLTQRLLLKEQLNIDSMSGIVKLSKYVIFTSFIVEFIGAIFLSVRFIPIYGFVKGIWYSIFHSISAFCNAGFDIIGNSIEMYNTDIIINLVIMLLVFLGGLGFTVYIDMYRSRKFRNFSMHTKMVLIMSFILLAFGTILFLLIEYNNVQTISNYSIKDKFLISAFQSTITRTAGFNSIPMDKIRDSSAFLMIILMFIGGSPASTAGGLKTTTLGVMMFTAFSVIRGEREAVFMKRAIPNNIIFKCMAITFICIGLVLMVALELSIFENEKFKFVDILFETVSAFGTVGLTRGITDKLGNVSKIILSFTMFLGRVGPTTLAIGLMRKKKSSNLKYAEGHVIVG